MKLLECVGVILSFGGLTQLFKWILDSLGIKILESTINFFVASIFSLQIVIILFLIQIYLDSMKMKDFLKTKGFKENMLLSDKILDKKGSLDPRILWVLVAIIVAYLLYKLYVS